MTKYYLKMSLKTTPKMLEIAFQISRNSKFSIGAYPQTSLEISRTFGARLHVPFLKSWIHPWWELVQDVLCCNHKRYEGGGGQGGMAPNVFLGGAWPPISYHKFCKLPLWPTTFEWKCALDKFHHKKSVKPQGIVSTPWSSAENRTAKMAFQDCLMIIQLIVFVVCFGNLILPWKRKYRNIFF